MQVNRAAEEIKNKLQEDSERAKKIREDEEEDDMMLAGRKRKNGKKNRGAHSDSFARFSSS
jgi:hypothetical protein